MIDVLHRNLDYKWNNFLRKIRMKEFRIQLQDLPRPYRDSFRDGDSGHNL
jgi:hypothetical protein